MRISDWSSDVCSSDLIAGTRDVLTSALLGSSPISAISDFNTQVMTRKLNGLPATRVLWSYLKQLNPASAADRRRAIRLGLGLRDASRSLLGLSRYYGRSEERRVGKECVGTGRSWGVADH